MPQLLIRLRQLRSRLRRGPVKKAAVDLSELDKAYERLKASVKNNDALLKDLDKLKATADSGLNISWWSRRFIFGFGLASAIEDWFRALDQADPTKNLLQRIPRKETSNVAAKWAWFGFFGVCVSALFGLSIAIVTAYFLYRQSGLLVQQSQALAQQSQALEESNRIAREANTYSQRTQYAQILYDEKCEEKPSVEAGKEEPGLICEPVYNARIRTEAALGLLKLEREKGEDHRPYFPKAYLEFTDLFEADLGQANLGQANLGQANLQDANLQEANLQEANLLRADLRGADLRGAKLTVAKFQGADLRGANLRGADLRGSNLWEADLRKADLRGADLRKANLRRADLREADLRETDLREADLWRAYLRRADLQEADLRGARNLDCAALQKADNWQSAYRDAALACGAAVPEPPKR